MKILIKLNHPAHFHLFKNFIGILKSKNIDVLIVMKNKDVLKSLLDSENLQYIEINSKPRKSDQRVEIIKSKIKELLYEDLTLYKIVKHEKPALMFGTDVNISHIGWLLNIPSYVFNEDDYRVNRLFCSFTYPFCTHIVAPSVCNVGRYSYKKISYEGYQKITYLHPSVFTPSKEIVQKYIPLTERFFLLRLVSFTAGHDIEQNHGGITSELLNELIKSLAKEGNVFLSTEKNQLSNFQNYILKIDPKDMHHILAYADLFISDSQSMTLEAAILGTPSIRFNSFVGKISVLEELETKYNLSIGINNRQPELLIETVKNLLKNKNMKNDYYQRRNLMLSEKINLTGLMVSFVNRAHE